MMRELKVPYAFDSAGRVIAPLAAAKGAHYTCLECDQRLDLKRSRRERPYFAHRPDAFGACSGESATHLAAKHLLKAQLEEELNEHGRIVWQLPCTGVGDHGCRDHATLTQQAVPKGWDDVALEVSHQGYRFDVAVMHHGRAVYGFEVFFRHEVPEAKAGSLNVPWLEFCAEDILAYKPRVPHKPERVGVRCVICEDLVKQLQKRAAFAQQRSRVNAAFSAESRQVSEAWQTVLRQARARSSVSIKER